MKTLVWPPAFVRAFKRLTRRQPSLRGKMESVLEQLAQDPFHATLHTHKLKGELSGVWACAVDFDNRILFQFVTDAASKQQEILLLTLGTHDQVY